MVGINLYALKGQKPLAQGIALGNIHARLSPCKGKSIKFTMNLTLLPLQGAFILRHIPRALPWARGFWAFSLCQSYSQNYFFSYS